MPRVPQPDDKPSSKKSFDPRRDAAFESKLAVALAVAVCAAVAAGLLAHWRGAPSAPAVGARAARDVSGEGRAPVGTPEATTRPPAGDARRRLGDAYARLPLSFEANEGQTDPRFKFISRGDGYGLFLSSQEAVLLLRSDAGKGRGDAGRAPAGAETAAVTMRLEGANPGARVTGEGQLPGRINYLTGRDEKRWRRSVAAFAAVRYEEVYAGVDLIFYGNQRQLEYDFVVAPGADPESIRMRFGGGGPVEVDAAGELVLRTEAGEVRQRRPVVYQESGGARREVDGAYALGEDGRVGFRVGEYDPALPLVIDPVLVYSTHLGGANGETLNGLAVDAAGNAYVTGTTFSPDFPATAGALKTTKPGSAALRDAFVTKFNVVGNGVVYSTFLGGQSGNDFGTDVEVDAQGHAYVAGRTHSQTDFPVTPGAAQTAWGGGTHPDLHDGFVAKLTPAGDALVYATYVGGNNNDYASDLALDAAGNAYFVGGTTSANFPTRPGAFRFDPPATIYTSYTFAAKLNAAGTAFAYSTYLGGGNQPAENGDTGPFVAVDEAGRAHVFGWTYDDLFPSTPDALQRRIGSSSEEDSFYCKLSPAGDALLYSTFLGGRHEDRPAGIALDAAGNAYVAGVTNSDNFPVTAGAYKATFQGSFSTHAAGYVTKFSPAGQVVYSTYFGTPASPRENIVAIAVNPAGEAWLAGYTGSADFPVTPDAYRPVASATDDNFISRLGADGSSLPYSTRFGGSQSDHIAHMALDAAGGLYVAGNTVSADLPTTPGSFQTALGPQGGLFVAKFGAAPLSGHSIGGRITDGTRPLAGIMIRLGGSLEGTQFTGVDGSYSFGSLPGGGGYTVTPSSAFYDFAPQSRTFDNLAGNETADFAATIRRFRIAGQVRDTGGAVMSGVTVHLSVGGVRQAAATTDADGRYAFADLPAIGAYDVRPVKANYSFAPQFRAFTNLTADVTGADFTGRLFYTVFGRITDASGAPIAGVRVDLEFVVNGGTFVVSGPTTSAGEYGFINLSPGQTYTVRPVSLVHSFAPPSQTFSNIGANQTANFVGTLTVATISGRVIDEDGRPLQGVTVRVGGGGASQGFTNFNGDYSVTLRKGLSYTLTPALVGYAFTPASSTVELNGNATANFTARRLVPQPFTPGNILVSADYVLSEYTPEGVLVQSVLVPRPTPSPVGASSRTGDLVLDSGGDPRVLTGQPLALAGFSRPAQTWQSIPLVESPSVGPLGGIATAGGHAFTTFVNTTSPSTRRGFVRVNLADNSTALFERPSEGHRDLAAGANNLLYALESAGSRSVLLLRAYNQQTLELVSERDVNINTIAIAANAAGDVFLATQFAQVSRLRPDGTIDKQTSVGFAGIYDMDSSPDGRLVISNGDGRVTLLDWDLNVLGSFAPPQATDVYFVAFAKPASVATVEFAADGVAAEEGAGRATVTVTRTGDLTGPASVEYSTTDDPAPVRCDVANGTAYARCDYATTVDTLRFAPGESQKTFAVPLVDDGHAEGAETVGLKLRRPSGAVLGPKDSAVLTIGDNDTNATPNPISGNQFFVRMHYLDFLSREPEVGEPWTGVLDRCPDVNNTDPTAPSAECDRLLVSQSFFQSQEFYLKGLYAFLFYRVAFDRQPTYEEIIPDMRSLAGATPQEVFARRAQYATAVTQRPEFTQLYGGMTNQQYVDALLGRYGLQQITTEDALDPEGTGQVTISRQLLVFALNQNSLTRAQVLRAVVQSSEVDAAEYHGAFVSMQYYGYLRRTPEQSGYEAWLRVIREDPNNVRVMVNGFMNSQEYRLRFGQP